MVEVWKEYGNTGYFISTKGNVKTPKGKIYKGRLRKDNYYDIKIKGKNLLVHRLVAILFIENEENLPIINHKDEIRSNNNVENLEWCTVSYNIKYGEGHKRRVMTLQGEKNPNYGNKWTDKMKEVASKKKRKPIDEVLQKPTTFKRFWDICNQGRANKEDYAAEYAGYKIGTNRAFYFRKKCVVVEGESVKATSLSAGNDIFTTDKVVIKPRGNAIIDTGIKLKIHKGFEVQIRGRSGLNFSKNLIVPTGTIDADYEGFVKVKMYNMSDDEVVLEKGERVAQMILSKVDNICGVTIIEAERGVKGFGSTGK